MHDVPDIQSIANRPKLDARPIGKRVGLVVLATDHTTEPDFQRLVAGPGIGVYAARIPYANPTTPENLRKMQPALTAGAALILPGETLDAICYSCTSASVVIGEEAVRAAINAAKPGVPVVTPTAASAAALRALGARRIGILTPYTLETSRPLVRYFAREGFEIAAAACLGMEDDREMARIPPGALVDLARAATPADAEALFISCTALRAALAAAEIEAAIGRPVVSSNLATAWACLGLCGDDRSRPEIGRLMALPASASRRST
ncbi:MAG TPA: ectoine utilization protein EutA [Hypericibacter adhaerens]|uniref:ectoine utilization protein EutA n=1 Tax=Hypericibacter adhaerens TaxID=2602016 RepID=UPI002B78C839|nr:ectoine utilization protein EutA [Hypericibacter adhaerens]HWA45701.1 ectoine utilization protein EutA [Hypericibacter adhaerens]